ncbi:tyrosine-type recombinase/integrase [Cryobacterium sp. TMT3-29-2]|uniref:tyrosine-type recombinase/integrase n=1 Tax=Cryobacterium sp. TMT3-29-2 TaxID=2555867 RepID=UPI00107351E4|nr:tyrosine-type recombinase/integrase [Cryobacterium sp. TMT3-29-2]TFC93393.1 integrase [Cryobacterium sp. TMT3-29-2]
METMVDDIGVVVVEALKAAGYAESTIGQCRKSIRILALLARKQGGLYTPGLGAEFALMTTRPRTGMFSAQRRFDYGRLATLFDSYVSTGRVSLAMRSRGGGVAVPQCADFVALWGAWSGDMERRGLATATRNAYGRAAGECLLFLEASGITSLEAAGGITVFGYLESLRGRWAPSALWTVVLNFLPFLTFVQRQDLLDALKMAHARRWHQLVRLLEESDEQLVIRACTRGDVPARDAAITLLALVTGLRACDIIALRLTDIDWRSSTLGIVQQKTGNPLTLPLPAVILGKLADYVLGDRPVSDVENVFLRAVAPHLALVDHSSIYSTTRRTFSLNPPGDL